MFENKKYWNVQGIEFKLIYMYTILIYVFEVSWFCLKIDSVSQI